jgi:hypothetical protein
MEKEMKELYGEGLATHADPESCVGSRKGAGEALTGAHVGRAIEPRKQPLLGADVVCETEGNMILSESSELVIGLARSKNSGARRWGRGCMRGISMCENREIP